MLNLFTRCWSPINHYSKQAALHSFMFTVVVTSVYWHINWKEKKTSKKRKKNAKAFFMFFRANLMEEKWKGKKNQWLRLWSARGRGKCVDDCLIATNQPSNSHTHFTMDGFTRKISADYIHPYKYTRIEIARQQQNVRCAQHEPWHLKCWKAKN